MGKNSSSSGSPFAGVSEYDRRRQELSPELDLEASEYGWGAGITPRGLEDAPANEGGRYHGTTPEPDTRITFSNDRRM
ncbi:hypothetical protein GCM10009856_41970 [Mycolicibacterium llatzerense]